MRIINVVTIKDNVIDDIISFGIDENNVQPTVEKAEIMYIEKAKQLGFIASNEDDTNFIIEEGYFQIMNASVCLTWSDIED
jgi:hypothetical protein